MSAAIVAAAAAASRPWRHWLLRWGRQCCVFFLLMLQHGPESDLGREARRQLIKLEAERIRMVERQ